MKTIKVTIWYEYTQESGFLKRELVNPWISDEDFGNFSRHVREASERIHSVYPDGLMEPLKRTLEEDSEISLTCTSLYDPEYGLPKEILDQTDVLIWWAHVSHDAVPDELADRIVERIQKGMGFIALHSAHKSKPFLRILGCSGTLKWRENDYCRLWNVAPSHPIAAGIPESIELPGEEMYSEVFDVPKPDDVVFMGWYRGGEVFRSGCTWNRGYGKVFYFQPGHETCPSYHNPDILRIIRNAVHWAAPVIWRDSLSCPNVLETPESKVRHE